MSQPAIVDYRVIVGPAYADVREWVCEAMKEGWQPFGGVSIAVAEYEPEPLTLKSKELFFRFAQAMVKYAES